MSEEAQFLLLPLVCAVVCCTAGFVIDKLCGHFAMINRVVKRVTW